MGDDKPALATPKRELGPKTPFRASKGRGNVPCSAGCFYHSFNSLHTAARRVVKRVKTMSLVRLIYVSRMTDECDMAAIQEILKVARHRNPACDITGMLCYDPQFFMQCLEGPKDAVNTLYGHIVRDSRHIRVTLLEYQEIERRMFEDWSMAFVQAGDLDPQTLRNYGSRGKFDPFALTPDQARNLVVEIVNQKQEHLRDQMDVNTR